MKAIISIAILGLVTLTINCSAKQTENVVEGIKKEIQEETTIKNVDAVEFKKLIETQEGQILDVRTPQEWGKGTIKAATKINFYDKDFKEQVVILDKEKPVYVYCKAGGRSSKAAEHMESLGFKTVYNLKGGIGAWKKANFETTK